MVAGETTVNGVTLKPLWWALHSQPPSQYTKRTPLFLFSSSPFSAPFPPRNPFPKVKASSGRSLIDADSNCWK